MQKEDETYIKKAKAYTIAANVINILFALVIPITAIIMVYICASPVAFTEYKVVNDVFYKVKEVKEIDQICITSGIWILLITTWATGLMQILYKKIVKMGIKTKDISSDELLDISNKVMQSRNKLPINIVKALIYIALMIILIIVNHYIN